MATDTTNPHYPFISMRLWQAHKDPALLDRYLSLLGRHRGAGDEVWFATDYGFPTLETHSVSAQQMASAAQRVRDAGLVASVQISNSLGHGDYLGYLDFSGIQWQRMVGPDGTESAFANCPRAAMFRDYLSRLTAMYCSWQPDALWIDDDLRMNHHTPVSYGCFCNSCVSEFGSYVGTTFTRSRLVEAITTGNDQPLRERWVEFCRSSLAAVARDIAEAVLQVSPGTRLGLQHADSAWGAYNGPDWQHIYGALQAVSGRAVGSRPGGGFYHDHAPRGMVQKALSIGLQVDRLPAIVDDVRTEIENLPGSRFGKSARGTVLEAGLSLAYGCTGLTFTPLMFPQEDDAHHARVLREIAGWRAFWLKYCAASRHCRPGGVTIGLGAQVSQQPTTQSDPFAWAVHRYAEIAPLAFLGIPLCWSRSEHAATLLHHQAVASLTDQEVHALLGSAVVTDGESARLLIERGFAGDLGVTLSGPCRFYGGESMVTDPATESPDGRREHLFGGAGTAWSIAGTGTAAGTDGNHRTPEVEVLSTYLGGSHQGAPATVRFTTTLGGRWVVFGAGCWSATPTTARRTQIIESLQWAGGTALPAVVHTPAQIVVVPRLNTGGRVQTVFLLNCSLDHTGPIELDLHLPVGLDGEWFQPEGRPDAVSVSGRPAAEEGRTSGVQSVVVRGYQVDGGQARFSLPSLVPWSVAAIVLNHA